MGDGMKRAKAAAEGPTVAQRAALKSAAADRMGIWCPVGAGQYAMARRMAEVLWWGDFERDALQDPGGEPNARISQHRHVH